MRRLVSRGANVTIADINDERAKGIVGELGAQVEFVHTDVTLEPDVQELVRVAAGRGPLRVVVNCAGAGVAKRVVGRDGTPHDLESFVWTVNLCLFGTFNVMRLAAAAMAKQRARRGRAARSRREHCVDRRVRRPDRPGRVLRRQRRRHRYDAARRRAISRRSACAS